MYSTSRRINRIKELIYCRDTKPYFSLNLSSIGNILPNKDYQIKYKNCQLVGNINVISTSGNSITAELKYDYPEYIYVNRPDNQLWNHKLSTPYYSISNLSSPACSRVFDKTGGSIYSTNEYKITLDGTYNLSTIGVKVGDVVKLTLNSLDNGTTNDIIIYGEIGKITSTTVFYLRLSEITSNDINIGTFNENSSIDFYKLDEFIVNLDNNNDWEILELIELF